MMKKHIGMFTILAVLVTTLGCYTKRMVALRPYYSKDKTIKKRPVYALLTKSGKRITFPKKLPAQMTEKHIVGLRVDIHGRQSHFSIPYSQVSKVKVKKFDPMKLIIFGIGSVVTFYGVVILGFLIASPEL